MGEEGKKGTSLYVFGISAGKDGQNTLKFENITNFISMPSCISFGYESVSTGEKRQSTFYKNQISGYSFTEVDNSEN